MTGGRKLEHWKGGEGVEGRCTERVLGLGNNQETIVVGAGPQNPKRFGA